MGKPAAVSTERFRKWFLLAIVWVIAFDAAFLWQRASGAHTSEFGGHPEEPSHYVTGLMAHDYIVARSPGSPMAYAKDYKAHYPVAKEIGARPPLFCLTQAGWMFPFGTSRTSVLLLMCVLAALVSVLLFSGLLEEFGLPVAIAGAMVLVSLPQVREYYSMVMPETLSALLMFAAALSFGRFLDNERPRHAVAFGVLAGLAILTQIAALSLIVLVPVAILLMGKLRILTRPVLWGGLALAALIAGPWTWHFRRYNLSAPAHAKTIPSWQFTGEALPFYLGKLGLALGIAFAILFCIGLATRLAPRKPGRGRWAALLGLIAGMLAFHCIVPASLEERHLVPALPAAVAFAVAGAVGANEWLSRRRPQAPAPGRPALVVIVILLVSLGVGEITARALKLTPGKRWSGFAKLAGQIVEDGHGTERAIMISSDPTGEGVFISELAISEKRPGHVVRLASAELGRADSPRRDVQPRFETEDDVAAWFANAGVDYLLIDESIAEEDRTQAHDQLIHAVDTHSERFFPMARSSIVRGGQTPASPATLYRVKHVE